MNSVASSIPLWVPFAGSLAVALIWWGRKKETFASFFAADRSLSTVVGGFSFALCWLWVFALMTGPQFAYEGGIAKASWFVVGNTLAIILFAALAMRMRKLHAQGYTLTSFIEHRYDQKTMWVYVAAIVFVQGGYAVLAQLIGALVLLQYATAIDKTTLVISVGLMMAALALYRGLPSAVSGDLVKTVAVTFVVCLVFAVAYVAGEGVAGGAVAFYAHAGGKDHLALNPLQFSGFGIPLMVSLIAGIAIDHQLWQRTFALSERAAPRAPWIGAGVFFLLVSAIASLGLLAAQQGIVFDQSRMHQIAGFAVIEKVLPLGADVFIVMIASALIVTGASALNAASSALAVDALQKQALVNLQGKERTVSRVMMLVIVSVGMGIALETDVTLQDLILFMGAFRGALLLPTLMALFTKKRSNPSVFFAAGIAGAVLYGSWTALATSALEGSMWALGLSVVICLAEWRGWTLRLERKLCSYLR